MVRLEAACFHHLPAFPSICRSKLAEEPEKMKVSRNILTQNLSTGFCAAQAANVDNTRRLPSSVPPDLLDTGKEWGKTTRIFQFVKHDSFIPQTLGKREVLPQLAEEKFIARGWEL